MQSRTFALVVAAALAAWAVCFGPDTRQSIAASDAQDVAAVPQPNAEAPSPDTTRLVPVDVLGTGVVHWAPRVGDASN